MDIQHVGLIVAGLICLAIAIGAARRRPSGRIGPRTRLAPSVTGLPGHMPGVAPSTAPPLDMTGPARVETPREGEGTVDLERNVADLRPRE